MDYICLSESVLQHDGLAQRHFEDFRVNLFSKLFLLNILHIAIMDEFNAQPVSGRKGRQK
jgi:hypothetical protein